MVDTLRYRHRSIMSSHVRAVRALLHAARGEAASALARGLRDEWCRQVLNFLAAAFGAGWARGRMLFYVLGVLEFFAALFAAVLVGRHGKAPAETGGRSGRKKRAPWKRRTERARWAWQAGKHESARCAHSLPAHGPGKFILVPRNEDAGQTRKTQDCTKRTAVRARHHAVRLSRACVESIKRLRRTREDRLALRCVRHPDVERHARRVVIDVRPMLGMRPVAAPDEPFGRERLEQRRGESRAEFGAVPVVRVAGV